MKAMTDHPKDEDQARAVIQLLRVVAILLFVIACVGVLSYFKLAELTDAVG